MIAATLADGTGRFRWSVRVLGAAELTASTPAGWVAVPGAHDAETEWVSGGAVLARPVTGLPATHTVAVGVEWPVADVPEGAVVSIDGSEAGVVDASGLVLQFPVAAEYRVDLLPPFPHRNATCIVTVTA